MPHSLRDNDADVRAYVQEHGITSVLDVGVGAGTYAALLGDLVEEVDGIEVWAPYVERFHLDTLYRQLYVADVRLMAYMGMTLDGPPYDLVVFGDVLEHMTRDEARTVWAWAPTVARHGLISGPTVHWPQGAAEGNPYETHVQDHLSVEDYRRTFGPFDVEHLYERTATFLRRFA